MSGTQSLAKSQRLLSASDFSRLKSDSRVTKLSHCMIVEKANDFGFARLGFAVSRKSGNSVRRSLFKRIIREKFRLSKIRERSVDYLVITNPRLKPLAKDEARRILHENLSVVFKA